MYGIKGMKYMKHMKVGIHASYMKIAHVSDAY